MCHVTGSSLIIGLVLYRPQQDVALYRVGSSFSSRGVARYVYIDPHSAIIPRWCSRPSWKDIYILHPTATNLEPYALRRQPVAHPAGRYRVRVVIPPRVISRLQQRGFSPVTTHSDGPYYLPRTVLHDKILIYTFLSPLIGRRLVVHAGVCRGRLYYAPRLWLIAGFEPMWRDTSTDQIAMLIGDHRTRAPTATLSEATRLPLCSSPHLSDWKEAPRAGTNPSTTPTPTGPLAPQALRHRRFGEEGNHVDLFVTDVSAEDEESPLWAIDIELAIPFRPKHAMIPSPSVPNIRSQVGNANRESDSERSSLASSEAPVYGFPEDHIPRVTGDADSLTAPPRSRFREFAQRFGFGYVTTRIRSLRINPYGISNFQKV